MPAVVVMPAAVVVVPAAVVMTAVVVMAVGLLRLRRVLHEPLRVELVAQGAAGARVVGDVVGAAREDRAVVDEHARAAVLLGPLEEPADEAAPAVVVPGRVLADHERELLVLRV